MLRACVFIFMCQNGRRENSGLYALVFLSLLVYLIFFSLYGDFFFKQVVGRYIPFQKRNFPTPLFTWYFWLLF